MKNLVTLGLAAVLLSACSKDKDPQPAVVSAPAPELTVTRSMTYPSASTHNNGVTYTQRTLDGRARLSSSGLNLGFYEPNAADAVSFTVSQAALTAAVAGTYQLQTRQNPSGTAVTSYSYTRINVPGSASGALYGNTRTTSGQLVITAYDAQQHLLSGTFEVNLDDLPDPTNGSMVDTDKLRCNLKLTGTFANLKVE